MFLKMNTLEHQPILEDLIQNKGQNVIIMLSIHSLPRRQRVKKLLFGLGNDNNNVDIIFVNELLKLSKVSLD